MNNRERSSNIIDFEKRKKELENRKEKIKRFLSEYISIYKKKFKRGGDNDKYIDDIDIKFTEDGLVVDIKTPFNQLPNVLSQRDNLEKEFIGALKETEELDIKKVKKVNFHSVNGS